MHPHIEFKETKHCLPFCIELQMHLRTCREAQLAENPVFRSTDLSTPTVKRRILQLRRTR
jgi:hypothetical protein